MSSTTPGVVIIGAGHSGAEAALAVRQGGYTGQIVLIGDESGLPYHRPPLSKAYLQGAVTAESLLLKQPAAYAKADIALKLGLRVTQIERHTHTLTLSDGSTLPYAQLILATGSRARLLSAPGLTEGVRPPNLFYLRTLADADALRPRFIAGQRLLIIGAGYIGLEVAAVARQCGLEVTLLEAAPRVLARVTAPVVSAFYTRLHQDAGVVLHVDARISQIDLDPSDGAIRTVHTFDGAALAADLVIAGIGVLPNVELAGAAGLLVDDGITTDAFTRSSDPDIFAIGDCSNHPSQVYGRRIRLESVPNALEQARCVAGVLCGAPQPYVALPWFWSDQYQLKLQMVGLAQGHDEVVLRGAPESNSFIAFYLRQGVLLAADCVNRVPEFMALKKLVAARAVVTPAVLADDSVTLKDIVAQLPV